MLDYVLDGSEVTQEVSLWDTRHMTCCEIKEILHVARVCWAHVNMHGFMFFAATIWLQEENRQISHRN